MTSADGKRTLLFATTALGALALQSAAFAQAQTTNNASALEEVVVTATRQTSTVNKVALSVSAVTQKNLDQQGIRSVADLSTQVPGFTYRVTGGDSIPQLSLRGIGGNAIASTSGGAPTTGVYIDDIAMQKRNLNGATSGSGTPMPLLYDLDRIEAGLAKRRSDGLTALRLAVTCHRLRSNRCGAISLTTGILPV